MPEIISRSEARAVHARHYFTGRPCINGHLVVRLTSSGTCLMCAKLRMRSPVSDASRERKNEKCRGRQTAPERREYERQYRSQHRERLKKQAREKYAASRAALRALKDLGIEI